MNKEKYDDLLYSLNEGVSVAIDNATKYSADLTQFLKVLENDARLADALRSDNPRYVCGNLIEDVQLWLSNLSEELARMRKIVIAKSLAWDYGEDDPQARWGYFRGFMEASECKI